MKKYLVLLLLLQSGISATCQTSQPSSTKFHSFFSGLFEDTAFSAKVAGYAQNLEAHPEHNDSFLIGKFPLVLSKAGEDWFSRFASLSNRVSFSKNLNDTIKDLSSYFEKEIKTLDYDSIAAWTLHTADIVMYDKVYEGFLTEHYRFFKNGMPMKWITISFWGGKQFYSWRDEPGHGQSYVIPINEQGLDLPNAATILHKD